VEVHDPLRWGAGEVFRLARRDTHSQARPPPHRDRGQPRGVSGLPQESVHRPQRLAPLQGGPGPQVAAKADHKLQRSPGWGWGWGWGMGFERAWVNSEYTALLGSVHKCAPRGSRSEVKGAGAGPGNQF
jgi:hypothetical protein